MHKLKHPAKETGKGRAPENKPDWVEALEHNDMVRLGECAKNGFHPPIFEGHVSTLDVNGKVAGSPGELKRHLFFNSLQWTPLGLACLLDNGSAVTLLLCQGAGPNEFFHRMGVGFSPMAYCRSHDKSFAHAAMVKFGVTDTPTRH